MGNPASKTAAAGVETCVGSNSEAGHANTAKQTGTKIYEYVSLQPGSTITPSYHKSFTTFLAANTISSSISASRLVVPFINSASSTSGSFPRNPADSETALVDKGSPRIHNTHNPSIMHQDARNFCLNTDQQHSQLTPTTTLPPLQWDWVTEHADRKRESKADVALHGASLFEVDRRVLKDVVREKMGVEVGRITFLSAGMSPFRVLAVG